VKLTSENVCLVFRDCLWDDKDHEGRSNDEMAAKSVVAKGIAVTVGFNPEMVKQHTESISAMLDELPESFSQGMSFLAACDDKGGQQWTGEHRVMEQLFLLGMAVGRVKECLPREMWVLLPGGAPYYLVVPAHAAKDPVGGVQVGNNGHTRAELQGMIDRMHEVSDAFYAGAFRAGCHGFIEFCGLMNEYIKVCQQSLDGGVDFSSANTHSEKPLVVHGYNINYIVEKIDCIFGPTIRANPEARAAFQRLCAEGN